MTLSIKQRLIIIGAFFSIILLVAGYIAVDANNTTRLKKDEYSAALAKRGAATDARRESTRIASAAKDQLLSFALNHASQENYAAVRAEAAENVQRSFQKLADHKSTSLPEGWYANINNNVQKLIELTQKDLPSAIASKDNAKISAIDHEISTLSGKLITDLNAVGKDITAQSDAIKEEIDVLLTETSTKLQIVIITAILLSIGFLTYTGRSILSALNKKTEVIQEIANGNTALEVGDTDRNDEIGKISKAVEIMKASVERSQQLLNMTNQLSVPVLLCDADFNITYANQASLTNLRKLEKVLPVSADKIVGANIDIFHKNPAHQRGLLKDQSKLPHKAKFPIGEEWLSLNASMLKNSKGEFAGAFVDWMIVTDEVRNENSIKRAQEEIANLIEAARAGVLDQRINASQFEGFYRELAESMNGLMDTIVDPVRNTIDVLGQLSGGNLTRSMDGDYKGAFAEIQNATNTTIARLKDMVLRIKDSAESVSSAASEISSGSSDLSMRTEQQASSLEETAASMEEITGAVKQNSENSTTANKLSSQARDVAEKGGRVVDDAVVAMNNIEKSSQKISDIISVIDEIAFQTNLLALNAAVEAARAGDAGKGFAVVASEVRSLAGRSASASKEIKALIMESAQEVGSGASLVKQSGDTLKEIVSSVAQVASIISEIASASAEQSSGIDEINSAIAQMDETTQQNAALVEENTAAAQSMLTQAQELQDLMTFFTLDEGNEDVFARKTSSSADNVVKMKQAKSAVKALPSAKKSSPVKKVASSSAPKDYGDGWQEF